MSDRVPKTSGPVESKDLRRFNEMIAGASPEVRTLLDYWIDARGDRPVPYRRDIDPMAVPRLLPNMWIYRWDDDADDFVCKLAGETLRQAWGYSIAGMRMRDFIAAPDYPTVRERWLRIITVPMAHYGSANEKLTDPGLMRAERLILPLASDDGTVSHVMGLSLYKFDTRRDDRAPLMSEDIVQVPCIEL